MASFPPVSTRVPRRAWRTGAPVDRTRERTAMLNQLLLGVVVLAIAMFGFAGGIDGHEGLFFAGVLGVFVATALSMIVPWNKLHAAASAIIPIIDIAAITAMRESSPDAAFGLLWIFPAMWLAGSFALPGLLFSVGSIVAVYWMTNAAMDRPVTFATLLLPSVIVAIASTSYLTARRASVQRRLLDNQTQLLGQALARARQQEETLTEVLDAVDFGIISVSPYGRVSVSNEAHGRLQRVGNAEDPEGDTVGAPAFAHDAITPLAPEDLPLARALRGETFDDEVVWFGAPGQERRALMVTARRIHDDAGHRAGSVIVSRDITAELSAIRAREDLVASVSHELRTPLTSIVGYLELVLEEDLPPSARRGLEVAERNANRLLSIVADILTASSSERSTVELTIRPEWVDIEGIVAASAELHAPRAAERGIRIDTSGLEPALAWVDPSRIRQVLDNLVSNAVKYNTDGGTIEVGTTVDGAHAWVVVRDSGTGISEAELPRLFDRFFRSDAVRKTSTHGSGLGLSISRDIVRSHGGEITVQSELDVGTTVIVRFPVGVNSTDDPEEGSP